MSLKKNVHFGFVEDGKIGKVFIAVNKNGIYGCSFSDPNFFERRHQNEEKKTDCEDIETILDEAISQLKEYFQGRLRKFDLKIDWTNTTPFEQKVYRAAQNVEYGRVSTYGELALAIGKPQAARAVGGALGRNPIAIIIPCHRIVDSKRNLHGFSAPGGISTKAALLQLEGHTIHNNRVL